MCNILLDFPLCLWYNGIRSRERKGNSPKKKFQKVLKKPLTDRPHYDIIRIVKGSTSNNVPDGNEKKFEKVLKNP